MKNDQKSRRIRERMGLNIPVRVRGYDTPEREWTEVSRLLDVTPFGARFKLEHPTEAGRLLHLTLAMPRALRCFDHVEDQYRVWALVRNVKLLKPSESSKALMEVGVAFAGKRPPASYQDDPSRLYEIANTTNKDGLWTVQEDAGNVVTELGELDMRRETRHTIPIEVSIEAFDDATASEKTVTENISRTGTSVFTSLNIERGRFVKVISTHYHVTAIAAVRSRRLGPDGIPRLHLEFVGSEWPLEGIE
jgi:hypothetical protein